MNDGMSFFNIFLFSCLYLMFGLLLLITSLSFWRFNDSRNLSFKNYFLKLIYTDETSFFSFYLLNFICFLLFLFSLISYDNSFLSILGPLKETTYYFLYLLLFLIPIVGFKNKLSVLMDKNGVTVGLLILVLSFIAAMGALVADERLNNIYSLGDIIFIQGGLLADFFPNYNFLKNPIGLVFFIIYSLTSLILIRKNTYTSLSVGVALSSIVVFKYFGGTTNYFLHSVKEYSVELVQLFLFLEFFIKVVLVAFVFKKVTYQLPEFTANSFRILLEGFVFPICIAALVLFIL